ncbi:MAG: hypothetical protein QNK83_14655 [Akkermansiaceae bacterium]|nr:hypothetical protein [bacterium]
MKIKSTITAFALLVTPMTYADEEKHDHKKHDHSEHDDHADHDITPPNGGRILHDVEPHAEFFITKERKVQITFLNDHGKAVASDNALTAIGGKRAAATKFTFEKTDNGFLSNEKLPEGNLVPIVLTFKNKEGQKSIVKFNVNMADCPTCEFLEYACTCEHEHEGEGHDHGDHKDHDHAKEKK